MTCNNAIDWSDRRSAALDELGRRANFRSEVLQTFLLYLFTYEMPIDKVRMLLGKVETDALAEFRPLRHADERKSFCTELLDRLQRIEDSTVRRAAEADLARRLGDLKDREQQTADSRQQTADSRQPGQDADGSAPKAQSPEPSESSDPTP